LYEVSICEEDEVVVVAKAKAKKKRQDEIGELMSPAAQKKAERAIRRALADMDELADERAAYANAILDANPPEIRQLVESMTEKMRYMQDRPRFVHDGIPVNIEPQVVQNLNDKIHLWVAVRLLVACAEWDIQVGNFKLPNNLCFRCAKKVRQKGKS
jgi:hypothetical protein